MWSLTKTLCFQLYSKLNTILTPLSGQLSAQVTLPSGPPLGAQYGTTYTTTCSCLSPNCQCRAITEMPIVPSNQNDILRWIPAKDGKCSTKNIYRHLIRQDLIQLPQQGSPSINHHANLILQRDWKSKNLPPLIKAFTWRLIRRALATGERASRYTTHIDKHCTVCGAVEDGAHLFFTVNCQGRFGSPQALHFEQTISLRRMTVSSLLYPPLLLMISLLKY